MNLVEDDMEEREEEELENLGAVSVGSVEAT